MKKLTAILLALALVVVAFPMTAVAKDSHARPDSWAFATDVKFFNASDDEETPGAGGAAWGTFTYWSGFAGTPGYDYSAAASGNGGYITATVYGTQFTLYVMNGGENNNVDIDIYVDGDKKTTYNPKDASNVNSVTVTDLGAGAHTVKAVAAAHSGWGSFAFNCITYPVSTSGWQYVDTINYFNASNEPVTPGTAPWGEFTYWDVEGHCAYEVNGGGTPSGCYVTTTMVCSKFAVVFVNGDANCNNNAEIYVDGEKVATYNPSWANKTENCSQTIEVTPGKHTIKVLATGGSGWQALPLCSILYVPYVSAPVISSYDTVGTSSSIKISANGYSALYYWTQIKDTEPHTFSFYVKGEKGEAISFDYEGSYGCAGAYTIKASNEWEKVEFVFTATQVPTPGDHAANGYPFRIYINPSSDHTQTFNVDNIEFDGHKMDFTGATSATSGAPHGAWNGGATITVDNTQDADDGSVDHLYINALVEDDGTYGIIFAENEYATDALLKLPSDGGSPLFSRICTPRDVILQSAAYGKAEISAVNLGGEIGDKVLALYWTNLPEYATLAARTYKVLADGTVVYSEITSITCFKMGVGNIPLAPE